MVDVINYRAGNGPSVIYALKNLNINCRLVSTSDEIATSTHLVFPGVGSAQGTLDSLKEINCLEILQKRVLIDRIPFLGVCIGLQVLFEHSEEGDTPCLGWLKGRVQRFVAGVNPVPQIGWNAVEFQHDHPILKQIRKSDYFYFVNSYYAVPEDKSVLLGQTDYGIKFCSMVASQNILATQFHTEKSGPAGLMLLKNFAAWTV